MGHEGFRQIGGSNAVGQDGAHQGGPLVLEGGIELSAGQGGRSQRGRIGEKGEDMLMQLHGSREKAAVSFWQDGCRCPRLRIIRRSDAELGRTHRREGWEEEEEAREG